MNELFKTLTFVAVALVLDGAAFVTTSATAPEPARTSTTRGSPFSPTSRTRWPAPIWRSSILIPRRPRPRGSGDVQGQEVGDSLDTTTIRPMRKDRLSKTAAAVMDLTKDTIRSDRAEDQEEMGVIDPLDAKTTTLKGRGKRITLRDSIGEGPGRLHHRQRDQGDRDQGRQRMLTSACPARSESTGSRSRPSPPPGSPTGSRPTCSSSRPARSARSSSTTTRSRKTSIRGGCYSARRDIDDRAQGFERAVDHGRPASRQGAGQKTSFEP